MDRIVAELFLEYGAIYLPEFSFEQTNSQPKQIFCFGRFGF